MFTINITATERVSSLLKVAAGVLPTRLYIRMEEYADSLHAVS
jgi:hypothetical protein